MIITRMIGGHTVKTTEFKNVFWENYKGVVSLTKHKFFRRLIRLLDSRGDFYEVVDIPGGGKGIIINCGDNCITITKYIRGQK
tara:strand:- start:402 stop:650 length:249 start_codon:yes stop_codon:yes gene_type:complete